MPRGDRLAGQLRRNEGDANLAFCNDAMEVGLEAPAPNASADAPMQ